MSYLFIFHGYDELSGEIAELLNNVFRIIVGQAEVQKYMLTYHSEGQFHVMFILYL